MQAYAYTAIDESTSVVALNLEAGFFAVVEYYILALIFLRFVKSDGLN